MRSAVVCLIVVLVGSACREQRPQLRSSAKHQAGRGVDRFFVVRSEQIRSLDKTKRVLRRGFGLALVEKRWRDGRWVGISRSGIVVPMSNLRRAKPSDFTGQVIADGRLDLAWVVRSSAVVRKHPDPGAPIVGRLSRLTAVRLLAGDGPEGYLRSERGWLHQADLALARPIDRPREVLRGERWLAVDLAQQVLIAYRGDRPIFATLVSAGVGRPGTTFATPPGPHRIVSKLRAATMDNLEHSGVDPYFYEEVPHSQYIGRVALHGAYWHDRFGEPRSHGCINVSLADAEFLFDFTRPDLSNDQTELAAAPGQGTLIYIEGSKAL